jgi:hypothetical protein
VIALLVRLTIRKRKAKVKPSVNLLPVLLANASGQSLVVGAGASPPVRAQLPRRLEDPAGDVLNGGGVFLKLFQHVLNTNQAFFVVVARIHYGGSLRLPIGGRCSISNRVGLGLSKT